MSEAKDFNSYMLDDYKSQQNPVLLLMLETW